MSHLILKIPSGKRSHSDGWKMDPLIEDGKFPLENGDIPTNIAGWNIPIFNRKCSIFNQRVHFPASYVGLPECINQTRKQLQLFSTLTFRFVQSSKSSEIFRYTLPPTMKWIGFL